MITVIAMALDAYSPHFNFADLYAASCMIDLAIIGGFYK